MELLLSQLQMSAAKPLTVLLSLLAQVRPQLHPPGWEVFPLTVEEVSRLVGDLSRDSLTSTNPNNQTCVISPVRGEERTGSCTWRSERRCKRVPTVRTVPVFSPWCTNRGEAGHLTRSAPACWSLSDSLLSRCRETVERRPLVSSVRVCTPTGTPDCRGPCDDCPDYCVPVEQSWCELDHSISTRISEREDCQPNTANGQSHDSHISELSTFFTLNEGVLNRFRYFHFLVAFISADWELCVGEDKKCCIVVFVLLWSLLSDCY